MVKKLKKNIAIIGLGYVGLPLAISFQKIYNVIGYDTSVERIDELKKNNDSNKQYSKKSLRVLKNIKFTNDSKILKKTEILIVTVPTPINNKNLPDLSYLKKSCKIVGKNIQKKSIIIFESTVYPGCTEEVCIPLIEKFSKKK